MSENTITITNSLIGNTIVYEGSTVIDNRTFIAVSVDNRGRDIVVEKAEVDHSVTDNSRKNAEVNVGTAEDQEVQSGKDASVRDVIDVPSRVVEESSSTDEKSGQDQGQSQSPQSSKAKHASTENLPERQDEKDGPGLDTTEPDAIDVDVLMEYVAEQAGDEQQMVELTDEDFEKIQEM